MKKIIACLLLLTMLLTGCAKESEVGMNAWPIFDNLEDFYKFVESDSRDPDEYTGEWVKKNVDWFTNINPEAFLRLEDLSDDPFIVNKVETCEINNIGKNEKESNCYYYKLNNVQIEIDYSPKVYGENGDPYKIWGQSTCYVDGDRYDVQFVRENDTYKYSVDSPDFIVYFKEYKGVTVYRNSRKVMIVSDGFNIELYTLDPIKEFINNPDNSYFSIFFTGTDRDIQYAIAPIRKCIEEKRAEYPYTEERGLPKQVIYMGYFSATVIVLGAIVGLAMRKKKNSQSK